MSRQTRILLFIFLPSILFAQKNVVRSKKNRMPAFSVVCEETTSKVDLDVNNVRAMILGSADMWVDALGPGYEVPQGSGIHSIFTGSLWIGAIDNMGSLKVAAQTYRHVGSDFWAGPMDTVKHIASDSACWKYDRVWKVNRYQVEEFLQRKNDPLYIVPEDILEWPGNGDQSKGEAKYLAPFVDHNADGIYNAKDGDYPAYSFTGNQNCEYNLLGDQTLWWIFNDAAGAHGETKGNPLGLEIHAQAFAYKTNDEINDATFYQYKAINRSTFTLKQMYWGQWIDADLGNPADDYVACDVKRGLGYTYNGDADDDVIHQGYGLHPPAIGCDFLGGPLADAGDGIDNDQDSLVDEAGERIKMSGFLYYEDSNNVPSGNPSGATHFYNYLHELWGDGSAVKYGGNGYNTSGLPCKFMYSKNSDPYGWGTNGIPQLPWDELSAGIISGDRRFLMSAGPFTMQPGAVQFITEGIVWARDMNGDNLAGIVAMQKADDKAQRLFDNCFTMPCYPPRAGISYSVNYLDVLFSCYGQGITFSWNFGDGVTSNQKFSSHTYTVSGTYNVCLKVTNACGTDSICQSVKVTHMDPPPWSFRLKRVEGNGNGGRALDWIPEFYDSVLIHNLVYQPVYNYSSGPVNVGVYDTTLLPRNKFNIRFDGTLNSNKWKIYRTGYTDTVFSNSTIGTGNLQMIPQWGMGIEIKQCPYPGLTGSVHNGFLEGTMQFSDTTKKWLIGLKDMDYPGYSNWIRSGTVSGKGGFQDDYMNVDPTQVYEKVIGGTWAPYRLCAATEPTVGFDNKKYYTGPGFKLNLMNQVQMKDLASVDVILTSDKSKWTRSVVLELCEDSAWSANTAGFPTKARKLDFRRAASVDKNGSTATGPDNNDFPTGMGWFPGYAVNLETGERLNIAFGENSALVKENGNDMKWNPTSNQTANTYHLPWDSAGQPFGSPVFGGQHYIYVFGHNKDNDPVNSPLPNDSMNVPRYDACRRIREILGLNSGLPNETSGGKQKAEIFADAMWVNIPLLAGGNSLLSSDVKIRLRVAKPYDKGYSPAYWMDGSTIFHSDTTSTSLNRNNPIYEFDASNFGLLTSAPVQPLLPVGINFFPNPFSVSATLMYHNKPGDVCRLRIFDLYGKVIRECNNLTGQSVLIERGNMPAGVYFYSLFSGNEKKASGKFVVLSRE